jgi:uncharacterized protein (UPF0212 family)
MPDYEIVAEVPVFINDVEDIEAAIETAHTKITEAFNRAGKDTFDFGVCIEECPNCGGENIRAAQAGGRALIGIQLSDIVLNAEDRETAIKVFIKEIRDVQNVNVDITYINEIEDDIEAEA